jgi:hypothetical protein
MPVMASRRVKQFAYGLLYLLIVAGIAVVVRSAFLTVPPTCSDGRQNQGEEDVDCGGPCMSCKVGDLSIIIKEKRYFDLSRIGKTTFYLQFENPTTEFWVKKFDYTLNVYNTLGVRVGSFSGTSSLAPGGKRPVAIVAANIDARDISRTDLGIMDPEWAPLVEYHVDGISITDMKTQSISGNRIYVSGVATNNVAATAKKLDITAIFKDREAQIVNASMTTIDEIPPFSKKNFEIFLTPDQISQIDMTKTELFVEVTR